MVYRMYRLFLDNSGQSIDFGSLGVMCMSLVLFALNVALIFFSRAAITVVGPVVLRL